MPENFDRICTLQICITVQFTISTKLPMSSSCVNK